MSYSLPLFFEKILKLPDLFMFMEYLFAFKYLLFSILKILLRKFYDLICLLKK